MRTKEVQIAERYGILARVQSFEADLLKIKDIVSSEFDNGVCFDLNGFLDDMRYVIIIPKYDIRASREDYFAARTQLRASVIELAASYDLHRTCDPIEDYGEHFYFVFDCGSSWNPVKESEE